MSLNFVIGIQARTANTRLPGKCRELIGGIPMLDRVIYAAQKSADYLNRGKGNIKVTPCLLTPYDDPLAKDYRAKILTFEGPEEDVLSRYMVGFEALKPDYMVRITSDCPMIPPFVITKHITIAEKHGFDYVSNVNPDVRTCVDGHDTEVLSANLLKWIDQTAKSKGDREHVTTLLHKQKPKWATFANVVSYADYSQMKLSVDTESDLEFVRGMHDILERKIEGAKQSAQGFFRI